MSKPDSQFYRRFGFIVVVLTVCFVGLILLARGIASSSPTDDPQTAATQTGSAPGATATAPAADTAAPAQAQTQVAAASAGPGAGSAQPAPAANPGAAAGGEGATVYQQACSVCHGQGIAGAPKLGDKTLWGPRIAQGKATLYDHALHGYNGKTGVMPAKAGRGDLSDAAVQAAVDYMVGQSGG